VGIFERGEIVRVDFPYGNMRQVKERPALVLGMDADGDVLLARITSIEPQDDYFVPIFAEDVVGFAFPKNSYIRCQKLTTIENSIIAKSLGHLNERILAEVVGRISSYLWK